ncbi:MAG: hypothetical protein KKF57_00755 [Firmicutes bacterium]|nr:hypothetical protein [Bacillota bacterium]
MAIEDDNMALCDDILALTVNNMALYDNNLALTAAPPHYKAPSLMPIKKRSVCKYESLSFI